MTIDAHTHPDAVALLLGKARIDPRQVRLPISGIRAALGFPSPTEDFQDDGIDLNELLISNAPATFFYRAEGDSMMLAGNRALEAEMQAHLGHERHGKLAGNVRNG
jgi:SOS-response transcriptional repressor LexA